MLSLGLVAFGNDTLHANKFWYNLKLHLVCKVGMVQAVFDFYAGPSARGRQLYCRACNFKSVSTWPHKNTHVLHRARHVCFCVVMYI